MGVNKVILLGNVGADPEITYPEKGQVKATFSFATNERFATGEVTEWHRIVMLGANAEFAEKYIRKGTRLYLEGRLRTRTVEDRFQVKRKITEIYVEKLEFLGRQQ